MKREDFFAFVNERMKAQLDILDKKGRAYSGDTDAFENFKRNGERLGLSKYQVWLVYFMKHIDSITNAVKNAPNAPVDQTEGLSGRVDDAINYLNLFAGMLKEDNQPVRPDMLTAATITPNAITSSHITQDAFGRYVPFPVDSSDRGSLVPAGVQYRPPLDPNWHTLTTPTKLSRFTVGTDFRQKL